MLQVEKEHQTAISQPARHACIKACLQICKHIVCGDAAGKSGECKSRFQQICVERVQAAHAGLGEVAREFLQEPSDSDLDEEDLNRCSDDDVDDLDG